MARNDQRIKRLYVPHDLSLDTEVDIVQAQAHYLLNVLRLRQGDAVILFNGRDGEWWAEIGQVERRRAHLHLQRQLREQQAPGTLRYLFAPLKQARLDYMVQKATELGVAVLQPVITQHTAVPRLNLDRITANVIEAAEQCDILNVPEVLPPEQLTALIAEWDTNRRLIYCDEAAPIADPIAALDDIEEEEIAVLIGPEGGFDDSERDLLRAQSFVTPIRLGPRILRADTAAIAALTLVQCELGDWIEPDQDA